MAGLWPLNNFEAHFLFCMDHLDDVLQFFQGLEVSDERLDLQLTVGHVLQNGTKGIGAYRRSDQLSILDDNSVHSNNRSTVIPEDCHDTAGGF